MNNPIYSITPFTLLDYPDKTACILWFSGCNMRCSYCHNPEIVLGKGKFGTDDVIAFLKKRLFLLDGVVFSGGECSLHPEIFNLANAIKSIGMLVKMDTNGTRPTVLKKMIDSGLVDYIAIDYKSNSSNYSSITKFSRFETFHQSLDILLRSSVPFEIRTTVHSSLFSSEDVVEMAEYLAESGYQGKYYIQHYTDSTKTLGNLGKSDARVFKNLESIKQPEIILRNFN